MAIKAGNNPDEPNPVIVAPPGLAVTIHEPEEGNPLNAMLPIAEVQLGWVIVLMIGAVGVKG